MAVESRLELKHLPISKLLLDNQNYRFTESHPAASQIELAVLLDKEFDLLELGRSLASNGYFEQEPMVGIPFIPISEPMGDSLESAGDKVIVVEGNRRLASLLLLTDATIRKAVPHKLEWDNLAESTTWSFSQIPVVVYDDRQQVLRYLGQRHITGIKKWEPLAKARFLFDLGEKVASPARVQQIAELSGTDPDLVVELYVTAAVIDQANRKFGLDTEKWEAGFSLLQRALTYYPTMAKFVGLRASSTRTLGSRPIQTLKNPIPKSHISQFEELISYIFGFPDRPAVIKESRDLSDLNSVIKNDEALAQLRASRDLDAALEFSEGRKARLLKNLDKAQKALEKASKDIVAFRRDKKVELAVLKAAEALDQLLEAAPETRRVLRKRQ